MVKKIKKAFTLVTASKRKVSLFVDNRRSFFKTRKQAEDFRKFAEAKIKKKLLIKKVEIPKSKLFKRKIKVRVG